jgi:hypothetical protein
MNKSGTDFFSEKNRQRIWLGHTFHAALPALISWHKIWDGPKSRDQHKFMQAEYV